MEHRRHVPGFGDAARSFERHHCDVARAALAARPRQRLKAFEDPAQEHDVHAFDRVIEEPGINADHCEGPSGIGRIRLILSRLEDAGIASPASRAASIQAATASSTPNIASSRMSPAEKRPGRSGNEDAKSRPFSPRLDGDGVTRNHVSSMPACLRIAVTKPRPRSFLGCGTTTWVVRSKCLKT